MPKLSLCGMRKPIEWLLGEVMEDSATLALVIQFVAGCVASLFVLRQMVGFLAAMTIGMCGSTIGRFLLPELTNDQPLTGLDNH